MCFLMLNLMPGPRIGSIPPVASVLILIALPYPTAPETFASVRQGGRSGKNFCRGALVMKRWPICGMDLGIWRTLVLRTVLSSVSEDRWKLKLQVPYPRQLTTALLLLVLLYLPNQLVDLLKRIAFVLRGQQERTQVAVYKVSTPGQRTTIHIQRTIYCHRANMPPHDTLGSVSSSYAD